MNDTNDKNEDVTPYRASGNLNTYIGLPKINVNDTMDVNIQNVNTNTVSLDDVNNNDSNTSSDASSKDDNNMLDNKMHIEENDNKKKKITIKLGPKFKIIFLVVFLFLVFVFLLPVIVSLFNK